MSGRVTKDNLETAKKQAEALKVSSPDLVAIFALLNHYQGDNWPKEYPNTYKRMKEGNWRQAATNLGASQWAARNPKDAGEVQDLLFAYSRKFNAVADPSKETIYRSWKPSSCKTSEQARAKFLDHVKYQEGTNLSKDGKKEHIVYADFRGKITVGYGHQVTPDDKLKIGNRISETRALQLLREDTADAWSAAERQARTLKITDHDFTAALASVNYQLGAGWNKIHPKTWDLMTQGRFREAGEEAMDSLWNQQTPRRVIDFRIALNALADNMDAQRQLTSSATTTVATLTPGFR